MGEIAEAVEGPRHWREMKVSVVDERTVRPNVIRTWAEFGQRLHKSQAAQARSAVTALHRMRIAGEALSKSRATHLAGLVQHWQIRLAPLEESLTINFGLNRWLQKDREEAYSDWLAWILQEIGSPAAVANLLFPEAKQDLIRHISESKAYNVDRERWVPEGHDKHAGRLDCVITFTDAVIVLELKKSDAEGSDTAKHIGYLKWLERQTESKRCGLLIANSNLDRNDYHGFDLLPWNVLCKRARKLMPILVKEKRLTLACLVGSFVGSVEQNLLGLPKIDNEIVAHGMTYTELAQITAYLTSQ